MKTRKIRVDRHAIDECVSSSTIKGGPTKTRVCLFLFFVQLVKPRCLTAIQTQLEGIKYAPSSSLSPPPPQIPPSGLDHQHLCLSYYYLRSHASHFSRSSRTASPTSLSSSSLPGQAGSIGNIYVSLFVSRALPLWSVWLVHVSPALVTSSSHGRSISSISRAPLPV